MSKPAETEATWVAVQTSANGWGCLHRHADGKLYLCYNGAFSFGHDSQQWTEWLADQLNKKGEDPHELSDAEPHEYVIEPFQTPLI